MIFFSAISQTVRRLIIGKFLQEKQRWIRAVESAELNVTMTDLERGNTYRFRVRASIAGIVSEPSEESEPVRVFKRFLQ